MSVLKWKIIPIMVISLTSCQLSDGQNKEIEKDRFTDAVKKGQNPCNQQVYNNDLTYGILGFPIFNSDTIKIKSLFELPVNLTIKRFSKNEFQYATYSFSDGENLVKLFYNSTDQGFYIEKIVVLNTQIKLPRFAIGQSKKDINKNLGIEVLCDTLMVFDEEQSLKTTLYFKDEILSQISVNSLGD